MSTKLTLRAAQNIFSMSNLRADIEKMGESLNANLQVPSDLITLTEIYLDERFGAYPNVKAAIIRIAMQRG